MKSMKQKLKLSKIRGKHSFQVTVLDVILSIKLFWNEKITDTIVRNLIFYNACIHVTCDTILSQLSCNKY